MLHLAVINTRFWYAKLVLTFAPEYGISPKDFTYLPRRESIRDDDYRF